MLENQALPIEVHERRNTMPQKLVTGKLDRRQPMREQLYIMLRRRILTGSINPGALIDEKVIAADMEISRTPVREALKRLSDEHLVVVIAQSATRAAPMNSQHVQEAYLIRRSLEMESAAQAASRINEHHIDTLLAVVDRQAKAITKKKYELAIDLDDEFHRTIALISDLHRLWRTIEISKAQLDRCRHIMLPQAGEGETTLKHHRKIISALKTKDSQKALSAMRKHLDVAYNSTVATLDFSDFDFPIEPKPGRKSR